MLKRGLRFRQMILYIFLDESGNFDFSNSPGATEWFHLTSLSTTNPEKGLVEFYRAKHEFIISGQDIPCFHASEDKQAVRDRTPNWRLQKIFYPKLLGYLLQYVFHPYGMNAAKFEHILVFLAKMQLPKGHREPMLASIKWFLKHNLGGVPFSLLLHSCDSHPYLQMVDYCCWAFHAKRERNEERPYQQIRHHVRSDFDIFASGYKDWY